MLDTNEAEPPFYGGMILEGRFDGEDRHVTIALVFLVLVLEIFVLVPEPRIPGSGALLLRRPLSAPTRVPALEAVQERAFFQQRNVIEVRSPRDMELNTLIAMFQIEKSRPQFETLLKGRTTIRKDESFPAILLTPPSQR
jgi:hypothetical protein